MIPFFQWTEIVLGPLHIYVWGLCVALGLAAALWVVRQESIRRGLSEHTALDMSAWTIVWAVVGARIAYAVEEWQYFAERPLEVFALWNGGMSVTGALIGAVLTLAVMLRRHRDTAPSYLDVAAFSVPIGMAIGRLGCFFIYDHPGMQTSLFFGQVYSDGIVRHNLGLYLAVHAAVLALVFAWLRHRHSQRPAGFYVVAFQLGYAVPRFFLDFLRATDLPVVDERYAGLTFAQYACLVMIAVAGCLWYTRLYDGTKKEPKTEH